MKKRVKLYNRIFEALHEDDKFVLCLDKTHSEIVRIMVDAMAPIMFAFFLPGDKCPNLHQMSEAALRALWDAMDDEALSNDTLGSGEPSQIERDAQVLLEGLRVEFGLLRKRYENESWMHAACLSIAEGAPGWDGKLQSPVSGPSLPMRQVQALRRAYEELRLIVIAQCSPLVGEALPDALKRTLEELRERAD